MEEEEKKEEEEEEEEGRRSERDKDKRIKDISAITSICVPNTTSTRANVEYQCRIATNTNTLPEWKKGITIGFFGACAMSFPTPHFNFPASSTVQGQLPSVGLLGGAFRALMLPRPPRVSCCQTPASGKMCTHSPVWGNVSVSVSVSDLVIVNVNVNVSVCLCVCVCVCVCV